MEEAAVLVLQDVVDHGEGVVGFCRQLGEIVSRFVVRLIRAAAVRPDDEPRFKVRCRLVKFWENLRVRKVRLVKSLVGELAEHRCCFGGRDFFASAAHALGEC